MAGRISLVEEYENKDMIVQVKKCLDQTEAAVEASETARDVSIASAAEAHEASTNANSASAQALTAAQTVSTYESRLGAVENESAGNRSSIQTMDEEITDIHNDLISAIRRVGAVENDLTNVIRKDGDPGQIVYNGLELRGTNRTSDTVVGQLNDRIVNAKRLIEEIENKLSSYELMVRTVNDQAIYGTKMFHNWPQIISTSWAQLDIVSTDVDKSVVPATTVRVGGISFLDKNKNSIGMLAAELTDDGRIVVYFDGVKRNGDYFRTPNIVDVQL